jgi:hypothetical protein
MWISESRKENLDVLILNSNNFYLFIITFSFQGNSAAVSGKPGQPEVIRVIKVKHFENKK